MRPDMWMVLVKAFLPGPNLQFQKLDVQKPKSNWWLDLIADQERVPGSAGGMTSNRDGPSPQKDKVGSHDPSEWRRYRVTSYRESFCPD